MYDLAITHYLAAAGVIEKNLAKLPAFKRQLIEQEAALYNNVAASYRQGQHSKKEVEYCTKVIDRAPYVQNMEILAKAYQRRGYALETLEKFKEAKEDMTRVKELQPSNQEASKALTRLTKALKDHGKPDTSELDIKLGRIKDQGNKLYGEKRYMEAISKFTEGVEMYLKDKDTFIKDKDLRLKITQIYTNKALSYHQLGDQLRALEDADHVLKVLDQGNGKALFRRAIANKSFKKYEEAVKDLQVVFKQDQTKKDIKLELEECQRLLQEQQKQKKEEALKPKQKIEEVH